MSLSESEMVAAELGITEEVIVGRLAAVNLTVFDRNLLHRIWAECSAGSEDFIRGLYRRFRETPQLASMLNHESRVERLIALQHQYLRELFCEPINREYVLRRLTIGLVHHRIKVTPQWYLATYAHFLSEHVDKFLTAAASTTEAIHGIDALHKSILSDAALVLDAYGRSEDAVHSRQQKKNSGHVAGSWSPDTGSPTDPPTMSGSLIEPGIARIRLNQTDTSIRAAFIGLGAEDLTHLKTVGGTVSKATPAILEEFYRFITQSPILNSLVHEDQIQRLTHQVGSYWKEFVDGQFDRPYAASRMRIGVIHESIGLEPQWYLVGQGRQVSGLLQAIPLNFPNLAAVLKAFFRALYFDITFVIDAYMEARANTLLKVHSYAHRLMAGLTSAVVIINLRSKIQFANESFISLAGTDPALLYMMDLWEVIGIEDLREAVEKLRREGLSHVRCMGQRGERLFGMTVMELEESAEIQDTSVAVVFDDVSDMVRLSDSIEQDSQQYKRLTRVVSAVLWQMDWPTQTILSISHPTLDLIGYRDVAMLGRPKASLNAIFPQDRGRFEACCEALYGNPMASCEYRMLRADGRENWVRSHLSRLQHTDTNSPGTSPADRISSSTNSSGTQSSTTFGIAAVTVDISQSRHSDQLRLSALEQLAGGIVHVVNNALTVISGNIELYGAARSSVSEKNEPDTDNCLDEAIQAAHRAAAVVAQLQAFPGGQFLRPRCFSVNDALLESRPSFQLQAGATVQLKTQFGSNL